AALAHRRVHAEHGLHSLRHAPAPRARRASRRIRGVIPRPLRRPGLRCKGLPDDAGVRRGTMLVPLPAAPKLVLPGRPEGWTARLLTRVLPALARRVPRAGGSGWK